MHQRISKIKVPETRHERLEVRLRKSQEKPRSSARPELDCLVTLDLKGVITSCSNPIGRITRYSSEEIVGKHFTKLGFLLARDIPAYLKMFDSAVKGRIPQPLELECLGKDGTSAWLEARVGLVKEAGKITRLKIIIRDITESKQTVKKLKQSFQQPQETLAGMVSALAAAVEMRDLYTVGHQQRVADLACAIAKEMGFPDENIEGIRLAGIVHDVGKIYVPTEILSKPCKLTEDESEMIKIHPQVAYNILKTVKSPWPIAPIVHQHHERMDGSGYLQGLVREDILYEARILAVADVVEAMASDRPHRPAPGLDQALKEISQNRDILYDAKVVDACIKLLVKKGFEFD